MDELTLWGFKIPAHCLTEEEKKYLTGLPEELPDVQWVWNELDKIWDEFGLDHSQPLSAQNVAGYYNHPAWLMNGVFTHKDPVSARHRCAIANYLGQHGAKQVADYGGGFGEMALTLRRDIADADVTIVEPYPSKYGLERLKSASSVKIRPDLPEKNFDAVIAQDVLEHIEDPIMLAAHLARAVKDDGRLIFANCFFPYIQCHLPSTFHLRHTFPWVMERMGLKYLGVIKGAYHAQVFLKLNNPDIEAARKAEHVARKMAPLLNNPLSTLFSKVKRRLIRR